MKLLSYEISPSRRRNFIPGVLVTKKKVDVLEVNFHWPSLVKLRFHLDPEVSRNLGTTTESPFLESSSLVSECQNWSIEDNSLVVILQLNKRQDGKTKLKHYSIHNLIVGNCSYPLRLSAKRSKPSGKRRIDENEIIPLPLDADEVKSARKPKISIDLNSSFHDCPEFHTEHPAVETSIYVGEDYPSSPPSYFDFQGQNCERIDPIMLHLGDHEFEANEYLVL
jgi:hypothetical protein